MPPAGSDDGRTPVPTPGRSDRTLPTTRPSRPLRRSARRRLRRAGGARRRRARWRRRERLRADRRGRRADAGAGSRGAVTAMSSPAASRRRGRAGAGMGAGADARGGDVGEGRDADGGGSGDGGGGADAAGGWSASAALAGWWRRHGVAGMLVVFAARARGAAQARTPHPPAPPEAVRAERSLGPPGIGRRLGFRSGRRPVGAPGAEPVARERGRASLGSLVPLARRHDGVDHIHVEGGRAAARGRRPTIHATSDADRQRARRRAPRAESASAVPSPRITPPLRLIGGRGQASSDSRHEDDRDGRGGGEHAARATDRVGRRRQRVLAEPIRPALREGDAEGAGHRRHRPAGVRACRAAVLGPRDSGRVPAALAGQRRACHQRRSADRAGHEVRQVVEPRRDLAEALVARVAVPPHRVGGVDGAVRPRGRQPANGVGDDRRRDAVHQFLRRGLDGRGRDLVRGELVRRAAHQVPPDQHPCGSEVPGPQRGLHPARGLVEPTQGERRLQGERLQHDTPPARSPGRARERGRAPRPSASTTSVTAAAPSPMLRPGARRSAQPSARPIQATGCQRAAGSPSERSSADRQEEDRWPPGAPLGTSRRHPGSSRGIPRGGSPRGAREAPSGHRAGAEVWHARAAAGPCDNHRVGHRAGRLHALGRENAGLHERPDLRLGRRDDTVHRRRRARAGRRARRPG